MSAKESDLTTLTVVAITATIAALPQFLPRLQDVHTVEIGTEEAADIHVGEIAATGFFIAVGIVAAAMAGSHEPIVAAIVLAIFVVAVYEIVLRGSFFERGSVI